jgi:hypothetical protein
MSHIQLLYIHGSKVFSFIANYMSSWKSKANVDLQEIILQKSPLNQRHKYERMLQSLRNFISKGVGFLSCSISISISLFWPFRRPDAYSKFRVQSLSGYQPYISWLDLKLSDPLNQELIQFRLFTTHQIVSLNEVARGLSIALPTPTRGRSASRRRRRTSLWLIPTGV